MPTRIVEDALSLAKEMSLYGSFHAPDGTPVITSKRVLALTDYLASIQVKE